MATPSSWASSAPPCPVQGRALAAAKSGIACEACRGSKLKCVPGPRGGPCKRCSEHKRECVLRTGAKKRATRRAKENGQPVEQAVAPSQTFSIDFRMRDEQEATSAFDSLIQMHEECLSDLVAPATQSSDDAREFLPSPPSSVSCTGAATSWTRSIQSFCLQPQFNVESATTLLDSFRRMLPYFPCIVLGEEETVKSMSRDRPFVLLAILACTSSSRTLQGHGLYDEEFRKVLALKVVAGGERSLQLLQGLLVYCAWYPFHLRFKDKRVFQYLRMINDMLHDLELNDFPRGHDKHAILTPEQMEDARAYLASYYIICTLSVIRTWASWEPPSYTSWTSTCVEAFLSSTRPEDVVLAHLARHAYVAREVAVMSKASNGEGREVHFMTLGLESQLREWQTLGPAGADASPAVVLGNLFVEVFLYCHELWKAPSGKTPGKVSSQLSSRIWASVPLMKRLFDVAAELEHGDFSALEWVKVITCLVVGTKLCFPLRELPGWDHRRARSELRYAECLENICRAGAGEGDGGPADDFASLPKRAPDIKSASQIIIRVLLRKYKDRIAKEERAEVDKRHRCPMMDGSLDEYLHLWDDLPMTMPGMGTPENFATHAAVVEVPRIQESSVVEAALGTPEVPAAQTSPRRIYHDLWATMTLGWGEQ